MDRGRIAIRNGRPGWLASVRNPIELAHSRRIPISTAFLDQQTPVTSESSLEAACRVARLADEFRGQDVIVLDVRSITQFFDYHVIVTTQSPRQMVALAEEANREMKAHGHSRLGIEGIEGSTWVLEDFGDVILHVFHPDTRKFYDLERLWADAERIDWRKVST